MLLRVTVSFKFINGNDFTDQIELIERGVRR